VHALDRDLARRIVERSMGVIGHNVNVMDADGVILGSGEPDRVGTVHEGALLAVTQDREVRLDAEAAAVLHGVRPGVNLPLHRRDEVIGAVGITGDPGEVSVLGGLIRVTAELMVEQAQALERSLWERREREDFLSRLLVADLGGEEETRLAGWARELGLDVGHRWTVVLVAEVSVPPPALRAVPAVRIVLPSPEGLVVLLDRNVWTGAPEAVPGLRPDGPAGHGRPVAVGLTGTGLRGVVRSYQTARDTLWVAGRLRPDATVVAYEQVSALALVSALRDDWRAEDLRAPWDLVRARDRHGTLAATFAAYCAHFGDPAGCARALHIHRNTLRYRLGRIEVLTGLRLTRVDDLVRLYVGAAF
jgi:carbohydrate diacid regulator